MAALSAGSITYTVQNQRRLGNSKVFNKVKLAFAAGQTYPTGGVAFTGGSAGVPNAVESVVFADVGTYGLQFNYNTSSGKIQMFNSNQATAGVAANFAELASSVTPGAMTVFVDVVGW